MRKLLSIPFRACTCLIVLLLALIAAVAAAVWLFAARAQAANAETMAATPAPTTYDIVLLLDQSVSMWQCDGPGSDPDGLRTSAANLFIHYLGADSTNADYRIGVVYFGGTAKIMAPLTNVGTEAVRHQLVAVTSDPEPIPWTNPLAALNLAATMLAQDGRSGSRRVVVMMTDGQPAWPADQAVNLDQYRQDLQQTANTLAEQAADFFIVHLNNPSNTCDQGAIGRWTPFCRNWPRVPRTAPCTKRPPPPTSCRFTTTS